MPPIALALLVTNYIHVTGVVRQPGQSNGLVNSKIISPCSTVQPMESMSNDAALYLLIRRELLPLCFSSRITIRGWGGGGCAQGHTGNEQTEYLKTLPFETLMFFFLKNCYGFLLNYKSFFVFFGWFFFLIIIFLTKQIQR